MRLIKNKMEQEDQKKEQAMMSPFEISLPVLREADPAFEDKLYCLDLVEILPCLSRQYPVMGRVLQRIVTGVLEEFLNPKTERFIFSQQGQCHLYLGSDRKLGAFKTRVIANEITRRASFYMRENYSDSIAPISKGSDDTGLHQEKEKWKPPVEAWPSRGRGDAQARKLATEAMQNMMRKYEKNNFSIDYLEFSEKLEPVYQPVWNVAQDHVTAYIAKPSPGLLDASNIDGEISRRNFHRITDIALMLRATRDLERALEKNLRALLIVPVSLETLSRFPFQDYYQQFFRALPEDVRSHLVFQLDGVGQDFPAQRLREIMEGPLKMARSMIVSSPLKRKNFCNLAKCRSHAISASLRTTAVNEESVFQQINRFARCVTGISNHSMITDISSRSLLCAAIAAGVSYVSGPAVEPEKASLQEFHPLRLEDIYENDLPAASMSRMQAMEASREGC